MTKSLSPIERMIDGATGYTPSVRRTVKLECSVCDRTIVVPIAPTDPPGAVRIRMACDLCSDEVSILDYFDEQGRQIDIDGHPVVKS